MAQIYSCLSTGHIAQFGLGRAGVNSPARKADTPSPGGAAIAFWRIFFGYLVPLVSSELCEAGTLFTSP